MRCNPWFAVSAIVVSVMLPNVSWAASVDARIERLENIIDNQVNFDLLTQLDNMQREVQELRGKIEEQQNEIHVLKNKQEKLYLNLDSRLNSLHGAKTTPEQALEAKPSVTPAPVLETKPEQKIEAPKVLNTEKDAYEAAYNLMNTKLYPEAIKSFNELLAQYPAGNFAPNAYYWLGEIYAAQWQQNKNDPELLQKSIDAFQTVINRFPEHHKAVDALLKLGLVESEQQHWNTATDLLMQVVVKSPGTSRARIAEAKLEKMRQEGHI